MVKESKVLTMSVCGGSLPLDFLNTVSEWLPVPGNEYLESYDDFVLWVNRLNVLPKEHYRKWLRTVKQEQLNEVVAMRHIRNSRVSLFQVFEGIATKQHVQDSSLESFNSWLRKTHAHRILQAGSQGKIIITFSGDHPELLPLWYITLEAERLILDHNVWSRIRMCPSCGWFFIDTSKGGRRRWCDMAVCGSRDKALRYYHSIKG